MSNGNEQPDKIRIETQARFYKRGSVATPAITFETLLCAITEVYSQALAIGWETKVLDDLSEWIRDARQQADQ